MLFSFPWYAFHASRWPNSFSISLFLLSVTLFYKAVTKPEKIWLRLIASAVCFGLLLNFRSDYWLMPLGFACLTVLCLKTKKVFLQVLIWCLVLYTCLIPWAMYTKKACGHYVLTSTNTGHVMFVGLGHDENNRWGIEPHDGDPLMHRLVDEHFQTYKHSTLDYDADQFLKKTFLLYITQYPWDYAKKCVYTFYNFVIGGFYPGEFYMDKDGTMEFVQEVRVRHVLLKAVQDPVFLYHNFFSMLRLILHTVSWVMGQLLLLFSYFVLPLTAYIAYTRRSLWMMLVIAALIYQTLINACCFHMYSYTANLYVFYLLNAIYGMSLLRAFFLHYKGVMRTYRNPFKIVF